jgi:DNA repair exonuclease SbcCD ATPase subunit
MIVESIGVCYWRNILREKVLGPFSECLNVVYASNGSGKSSLFEALRRGLIDRHNVKGEDINEIQPWGRDLAPRVVVEFRHKGHSYRITKQFIQAVSSLLEEMQAGRYNPIKQGLKADEAVREMLTRNPPAKGLSRVEHWGWAQALWAPQGSLALDQLSNDVLHDIRDTLSAHLTSSGSSRVEKEINRLYDQYFTGTGKLKKGKDAPASVTLRQELEKARTDLIQAKDRYESFQRTSSEVEKCRLLTAKARLELDRIEGLLSNTESSLKEYRELKAARSESDSSAKIHAGKFAALNATIEQIAKTENDIAIGRIELEQLAKDLEQNGKEFEIAEDNLTNCQEDLDRIKTLENEVNDMTILAESARSYSDIGSKLTALKEKLTGISVARERLTQLELQRKSVKSPNEETLKAIGIAIRGRDDTNLRIDASLMHVEVMAERGLTVDVTKGDDTGTVDVRSGDATVFRGSPEVSVRIPDIATIRAWGPTGSIDELREKLSKTQKKISQLTEPYGTTDLTELERNFGQAKEISRNVREAELEIKTLLGKSKIDALENEKATLEHNQEVILDHYPEWASNPPDWENLKKKADKLAESHAAQREQASKNLEEARKLRGNLDKSLGVLRTKIEGVEKAIGENEKRLNGLNKDNKTTEQSKNELNEISMSWNAAKIKLEELENQLKKFDQDPEALAKKLTSEKTQTENHYGQCKDQESMAIGSLKVLSEGGSYSELAEAHEKIVQLEKMIQREELDQDAIRLLHDTIDSVRKEALSSVSRPVEDAATKTLNYICGADLGRISLGDTFQPSELTPELCDFNVGVTSLSGGEREQLYFAVRLALADVLAQDERQLVVLDDVLTATDSMRLGRVLDVLEDSAKRLQIILLTCHPERYQRLSSAQFFDFSAA